MMAVFTFSKDILVQFIGNMQLVTLSNRRHVSIVVMEFL